jgi:hypothetical protein
MKTFTSVYQDDVFGELTMFDRMIFRGHLTAFYQSCWNPPTE